MRQTDTALAFIDVVKRSRMWCWDWGWDVVCIVVMYGMFKDRVVGVKMAK